MSTTAAAARPTLKTRYLPIEKISVRRLRQMYELFREYYANTDLETFARDMSGKTGIFVIEDIARNRIVGFSTYVSMDMEVDGRVARGMFSGDTIIEKEYWGCRALHAAFYRRVIREKLRRPFTPLFWMLISKGYRTYLLLANNLLDYYPHPEGRNGHLEAFVRSYCEQLFPGYYCEQRKLLDFGEGYNHLREGMTPITEKMRRDNPVIGFFERCNPTWQRGTELPCLGVIRFADFLRFPLLLWRKKKRRGLSTHRTADGTGAA